MMIHTMRYSKKDRLWTAGYFEPVSSGSDWHYNWHAIEDFDNMMDAAAFVSYLNGGQRP